MPPRRGNARHGICPPAQKRLKPAADGTTQSNSKYHMQAFGYLLRKAPVKRLPKAVAAVVAEGVANSSSARVHGAAEVLVVSILGPSHALHSRAETLLSPLFAMLSPDDPCSHTIPGVLRTFLCDCGAQGHQAHTHKHACVMLLATITSGPAHKQRRRRALRAQLVRPVPHAACMQLVDLCRLEMRCAACMQRAWNYGAATPITRGACMQRCRQRSASGGWQRCS
jgi:hypothetical protein